MEFANKFENFVDENQENLNNVDFEVSEVRNDDKTTNWYFI